jgi:hypothetical protein
MPWQVKSTKPRLLLNPEGRERAGGSNTNKLGYKMPSFPLSSLKWDLFISS